MARVQSREQISLRRGFGFSEPEKKTRDFIKAQIFFRFEGLSKDVTVFHLV